MAKKKKKMTRAQAAAARREDTLQRKARENTVTVKDNGPVDRGNRMVIGVSIAMIALIVVVSAVFAILPTLGMNG